MEAMAASDMPLADVAKRCCTDMQDPAESLTEHLSMLRAARLGPFRVPGGADRSDVSPSPGESAPASKAAAALRPLR
jgi:hypothetical protein